MGTIRPINTSELTPHWDKFLFGIELSLIGILFRQLKVKGQSHSRVDKWHIGLEIIKIQLQFATSRGDAGTLRRKNSILPNINLIFKIKHFDDTYRYSIQWGYFWAKDKKFQKCVTFLFSTEHNFKKMSQCTPYSGTLIHHLGYLETSY